MKRIAYFLFSIFLFSMAVFAQDLDDVTISGKVTDSNNQAILGASVTATLVGKGTTRTVQTNDEGVYRLIELPPGTYIVKVTMQGFGSKERKDLVTVSGQNVQLSFQLTPGDVSATVDVTPDETPTTVDTTRTVVGGTVTEREIEELPNTDRNALNLVLTLGGTAEEAGSVKDLAEDRNQNSRTPAAEQGNFSLSGGASYSNNITIDGFDNNDDRSAADRFQPSLEAVQEVQVITNQFSAEYGRASGGRVNLSLRSGANKYHGRAYMFFRDDNLNANTWYNNSRAIPRLPLTEYNPGFTFSGPVIIPFGEGKSIYDGHNRTFFAVNYEYDNLQDTTLIDTYVPVVGNPRFALPAGNASCPVATCTDGLSGAAVLPYVNKLSTPNLGHIFTAKIDHDITSNNHLIFGWQLGRKSNKRTVGTSTTRLDEALQVKNSNTDALNVTDSHVFGANLVNTFKFQWSLFQPSYETDSPNDPVVLIGYRSPIVSTGSTTLITGNSTSSITGVSSAFAQSRKETRYQFQDAMTYIKGSHTLKFGADVQRVNSKATVLGDATGTFNFLNMLTYSQNVLSRYRQNFGNFQDVNNTYWGAFFNDSFQMRPNFTFSYGVRYEKETAISDNNNFGPRIGIAWDPFKKGKGVIRFGAGIFYNRVLLRTVGDFIQNQNSGLISFDTNNIGTGATDSRRVAILAAIANNFPNTYPTITQLQNLVSAVCPTVVAPLGPCNSSTGTATSVSTNGNPLRSVDPNLKIPESYQFNVGFERELAKGFVFEANYTWNKTAHLWRDLNNNAPRLPAGFADWTAYLLANPYTFTNSNGTVRTYNFYLGTDPNISVSTVQNGAGTCSTTANVTCFVNLNTSSSSSTAPSTAVTGSTTNSIGGAIGIATAAIARFRPDQSVQETSRIFSGGNSFYNGLVLELRSRRQKLGYGFASSFRFAYTLSIFKDDGLNNTANAEINGDFSREWARTVQDRRHRIAVTAAFDVPNWLGKLRFSPLFRFGSSNPFNLGNGGVDRNLDDLGTDRINFSGNIKDIKWRAPGSPDPTALFNQFSLTTIGSKGGNLPRNAGTGPSFYMLDLNVSREFKFGERAKLRPNIQIGNILNAAVFSYGADFIDFSPGGLSSFLVPTRTYRQREVRIGMRFDF